MIDWLNPSDDVIEARRIGYEEGLQFAKEEESTIADSFSRRLRRALYRGYGRKRTIKRLLKELERLRADARVRKRVDKTADGTPLEDANELFCPYCGEQVRYYGLCCDCEHCHSYVFTTDCYASREAWKSDVARAEAVEEEVRKLKESNNGRNQA